MDFVDIINRLSQNEPDKMKRYIYSWLIKYNENVTVLNERNDEYLPLLFIKEDALGLIYSDDNFEGFQYIFTNCEEILIILQKHLSEDKQLFFYFSGEFEETIEEILSKIDESLVNNDEESFAHYSKLLIDRRK